MKVARPARRAPSRERGFWSRFLKNRAAAGGGGVLLVMLVLAVAAGWVAPHGPHEDLGRERPPVFQKGGSSSVLLGTDVRGYCVLCWVIHGARYSLGFSLGAVGLSLLLSIALGLVAVFAGGVIDVVLMRLMDLLLSVPSLLLAIVIVTMLGRGHFDVWGLAFDGRAVCAAVALAFVYMPHFVRLLRATARAEMGKDYVVAARLDGVGAVRLMTITVLPNCMAPIIVQATLSVSNAVLDFAALGYLGLGVEGPVPEWGRMLAGFIENEKRGHWWVPAAPAMAIVATVVSLSHLTETLAFHGGAKDRWRSPPVPRS